jgi:hypothetical protein
LQKSATIIDLVHLIINTAFSTKHLILILILILILPSLDIISLHGVFSQQQNTITTLGTGRIVMVDCTSGKKVKPTDKLLQAIAQLQRDL